MPAMAQGGMSSGPNTMKPASFDSILSAARKQLPASATDENKTIENKLAAIRDSSQMAVVFIQLAEVWEKNKQLPVAGYYSAKAAKLENSKKMLNFAGQFFLERTGETNSTQMQLWELSQAEECFQRGMELDKENDTAQIGLATVYVARGETMKGVGMLRDITQKHPDNIPANMMLGRLSIQSGQFDKAIARFETILKGQPQNVDALLYLGEAYEGKGEKDKAVEIYNKCKEIVNDPEFIKSIDQHINSLK